MQRYNITPKTLIEIVKELEEVFGKRNVVIIGGRATNIYCSKDYRDTDDIDIVVKSGTSFEKLNDILINKGYLHISDGSDIHSTQYERNGVKIDLYVLYPGEDRTERPVSYIPKEDIIKNAERKEIDGKEVRVVDPVRLVLMKYNSRRKQDLIDIANVIDHVFGNFYKFIEEAEPIIKEYLNESGMMNRYPMVVSQIEKIYSNQDVKSDYDRAVKQTVRKF
jgi:predicted nucleotidyltransferase